MGAGVLKSRHCDAEDGRRWLAEFIDLVNKKSILLRALIDMDSHMVDRQDFIDGWIYILSSAMKIYNEKASMFSASAGKASTDQVVAEARLKLGGW